MASHPFGPPPAARFEVEPTAEQVAFFKENGFLAVERITSDEEIAWLRAIFEHIFDPANGAARGSPVDRSGTLAAGEQPKLTQAFFPEMQFPELLDSTYRRNAKRFAAALLDVEESRLTSWGHMIRKPPNGKQASWHQDHAYWQPEFDYHALGAWLPLHDVSVEMGAMQFIPGSHKRGLLKHRQEDDPKHNVLTVDAPFDGARGVERGVDGEHVVLRVVLLPMLQQAALVRAGNELHGAHLDADVVQRQPGAERVIVELGLPVGVVLVPRGLLAVGGLADHVPPAGQPALFHVQQRGGEPLGVPSIGAVRELRKLHLREEGLRQLRLLAGRQRAGPVDRAAARGAVGGIEDVLEDRSQPGDLLVAGDALDGEEAVFLEEGDLLGGRFDLEAGGGRWPERMAGHAGMLVAVAPCMQRQKCGGAGSPTGR